MNGYSVGVELENVGPLTKVRGHLQNCYGTRHLGPVLERAGRWWEPYTAGQYKAAGAIRDALRGALGELEWVGHVDVSPGRKTDPYPSWDWARFGEVAP